MLVDKSEFQDADSGYIWIAESESESSRFICNYGVCLGMWRLHVQFSGKRCE